MSPIALTAGQLRQVCRAGLANIHGQALSAMQIDGLEGQVVNASWPAPVDGGRRRAQCRVEGEVVTWKPSDAKNPEEDRWMNTAADPVTRFALDGDQVPLGIHQCNFQILNRDTLIAHASWAFGARPGVTG